MLGKYKVAIFHTLCILALVTGGVFLKPFVMMDQIHAEEEIPQSPIIQEVCKKTIWKRGKNPSTTIIEEKSATTDITEKEHTSKGWTSIKWRQNDP